MNKGVKLTERTKKQIIEIYRRNFDKESFSYLVNINQFQNDILNELIYLENKIISLDYMIKRNTQFIQDLVSKELKFKSILKIYSQNIKKLREEQDILKNQRFLFLRFADCIPFSIFPRDEIRSWLQLEKPGFLIFKTGLALELKMLNSEVLAEGIAILCDITNCMRIGDIYHINKGNTSIYECKTRCSKKDLISIDLSGFKGKIKRNMLYEKALIESDLVLEDYSEIILKELNESYEKPIIELDLKGVIKYIIINWKSAEKDKQFITKLNEITKFNNIENKISNPSLISQILNPSIAPIFSYGIPLKIILDLFDRRINLVNIVDINELNKFVKKKGHIWKFNEKDHEEIKLTKTNEILGKILYPWELFLSEFLTVESFVEYCNFLVNIKKIRELTSPEI